MPHLGDERQSEDHQRAGDIEQDQEQTSGQAVGVGSRQGCNEYVHDHLDGQGRAQNGTSVLAGKIVGEQAEGDGGQAGAEQRDDLGAEQATVVADGEEAHLVCVSFYRGVGALACRTGPCPGAGRVLSTAFVCLGPAWSCCGGLVLGVLVVQARCPLVDECDGVEAGGRDRYSGMFVEYHCWII